MSVEPSEAYRLDGKVALITGAARGQGAAEAELFAACGATVVLADVLDDEGRGAAERIPGALFQHLDVSQEDQWAAAIARVVKELGRLDILVNNAAISHFAAIEDTRLEDAMRVMSINLIGPLLGIKAVLPAMKRHGGAIVNVSSSAGLTGRAGLAAYASSKWGVRGLSKCAALELGRYGIRVNLIVPGVIDTPMTRSAYGAERLIERGRAFPVGRHGEPRDIARLALFLASEASAFCTGGEYLCDGGEMAGMT